MESDIPPRQTILLVVVRLRSVFDANLHALDLRQLDVRRRQVHCHWTWICRYAHLFQHSVFRVCWSDHIFGDEDADHVALRVVDAVDAELDLLFGLWCHRCALRRSSSTRISLCLRISSSIIGMCVCFFFPYFESRSHLDSLIFSEFLRWMSRGNSRSHTNLWIGYCHLSRTMITGYLVIHLRSCRAMFLWRADIFSEVLFPIFVAVFFIITYMFVKSFPDSDGKYSPSPPHPYRRHLHRFYRVATFI